MSPNAVKDVSGLYTATGEDLLRFSASSAARMDCSVSARSWVNGWASGRGWPAPVGSKTSAQAGVQPDWAWGAGSVAA
jgi:hypothetical protein